MSEQRTINIDKKEYSLDSLSEGVKKDLLKLRAIDREISRLKTQLAIAQTARAVVAGNVKNNLPDQATTGSH